MTPDLRRAYLVIPKLIEQPTWGGDYIIRHKNWQTHPVFSDKKIGQSYELFDKSNLSLALSSSDAKYSGELTDNQLVETPTSLPNSIPLSKLIKEDPEGILGKSIYEKYGGKMFLLIKFTQALGNSFQIHIRDGETHPRWKPKPESWYYFEPGLITLGVKKDTIWVDYQKVLTELNSHILVYSEQISRHQLNYETATEKITRLVKKYNPWQYVNLVFPQKDDLVDLSPCGIHHSWEEDTLKLPLGNVLYEVQLNLMDNESTIRSFDKGKMNRNGHVRPLQIEDYFKLIDRSDSANDTQTHFRNAQFISSSSNVYVERLLKTKYYKLDKITLTAKGTQHSERISSFRHVFVKSGQIELTGGIETLHITSGHSVFIPATIQEYTVTNKTTSTEMLVSY